MYPEDGGKMFLRNFGNDPPDSIAPSFSILKKTAAVRPKGPKYLPDYMGP
jgi:hypothetical protein